MRLILPSPHTKKNSSSWLQILRKLVSRVLPIPLIIHSDFDAYLQETAPE
jgi:hypothetical protein